MSPNFSSLLHCLYLRVSQFDVLQSTVIAPVCFHQIKPLIKTACRQTAPFKLALCLCVCWVGGDLSISLRFLKGCSPRAQYGHNFHCRCIMFTVCQRLCAPLRITNVQITHHNPWTRAFISNWQTKARSLKKQIAHMHFVHNMLTILVSWGVIWFSWLIL